MRFWQLVVARVGKSARSPSALVPLADTMHSGTADLKMAFQADWKTAHAEA
jgi:hypothetical protein